MALNLLLSYAYAATTDLARAKEATCGRIMVDSGAFTAHTTGRIISLGEYAEYLERWRGCWDHAVTLDVIGDSAATARNTRKLHDRGLPVMPVFTRGGKLPDFRAMVKDAGYVCAGGLVGLPKSVQVPRVGLLQQVARELGGGIHALGIGSMSTFRHSRPYSGDASTPAQVSRFGNFLYFDGADLRQVNMKDRAKLRQAVSHLVEHGVNIAPVLYAGRMPGGDAMERMRTGFYTAFACADEVARRANVPPPRDGLSTGSHLYCAVSPGDLPTLAALDERLHGVDLPPIWRRYGATHTCHRRTTPNAS